MAQDRAPTRPLSSTPFGRDGSGPSDGGQGRGNDDLVLEALWRQVVAGFVIVPCICTNAGNVYTLTPRLHKEGAQSYGDGMTWVAAASATSGGDVTAKVADAEGKALPEIKVYKTNGAAQATTNDIVSGSVYLFIYNSALDGGNGGLVLK